MLACSGAESCLGGGNRAVGEDTGTYCRLLLSWSGRSHGAFLGSIRMLWGLYSTFKTTLEVVRKHGALGVVQALCPTLLLTGFMISAMPFASKTSICEDFPRVIIKWVSE